VLNVWTWIKKLKLIICELILETFCSLRVILKEKNIFCDFWHVLTFLDIISSWYDVGKFVNWTSEIISTISIFYKVHNPFELKKIKESNDGEAI